MNKSAKVCLKIQRKANYRHLLEILGLYQGEGLRNTYYQKKVQFSNAKPELVNKFLISSCV